jgi:Putative MetA-pathway of phenol degradation
MDDVPVGTYDSTRLANLGIGHGALDGGVGYTYFIPQTGRKLSIVTGLTGNFVNPSTNYQNGTDWHLDWGVSQFLTKQLQIGAIGYVYKQLSADTGAPLILGENKSQVVGVGPQIGYLFPVANMQGYLNLKAYWEFDAQSFVKLDLHHERHDRGSAADITSPADEVIELGLFFAVRESEDGPTRNRLSSAAGSGRWGKAAALTMCAKRRD